MKLKALCSVFGVAGSGIAYLFGGWDASIQTLLVFMAIDFISAFILAGVFKKSTKTESGALESKTCWKGLVRKGMTLLVVVVATYLDRITGQTVIRDAVCIAFIVNETISIIENAGLMGVPIPSIITNAIDLLKSKTEVN